MLLAFVDEKVHPVQLPVHDFDILIFSKVQLNVFHVSAVIAACGKEGRALGLPFIMLWVVFKTGGALGAVSDAGGKSLCSSYSSRRRRI